MLELEMRRAFQRHRPAHMHIGALDLGLAEADAPQHVEAVVAELFIGELQNVAAEIIAERIAVEHEFDVEGRREASLDLQDLGIPETPRLQRRMMEGRGVCKRAMAD